ncbi:group II truncated hemoglobin [Aliisedimentitalea scapharcae]|uniref:Group II truncated hemoglobin n=1 Tax=Aliisedimentitalea scapharcae TaxID=1524259 RepID=A0ABZ2XRD3_9RHOB|nr:group II truncated hemoglobin [Rhodobacteraceae bacterium M382]
MVRKLIDEIGGEETLRALVEHFYDLVEENPEGAQIVKLHKRGHGMGHARVEQFNFLSGFMGGRKYYQEKHGHMDVKLMHEHVPITTEDAENWLKCMDQALLDLKLAGPGVERLRAVFRRVALMLVNDLAEWGEKRLPA